MNAELLLANSAARIEDLESLSELRLQHLALRQAASVGVRSAIRLSGMRRAGAYV